MYYNFNILHFVLGLSNNSMLILTYYTGKINTGVKISIKH